MNNEVGSSKISKISISNFKALRNVELNLKSLNYLLGENSLGKSSVSQALRFLAQNLRDSEPEGFRFNLPGLKLGQYEKILSDGANGGFSIAVELGSVSSANPNTGQSGVRGYKASITSAFHPEKHNMVRTISDVIVGDIREDKSFMAKAEGESPKHTRVPLQEFEFELGPTKVLLSSRFAGYRRWVTGHINEFEIPSGTWIELRQKDILNTLTQALSGDSRHVRFQSLSLDREKIKEILEEHRDADEIQSPNLKELKVSLDDALIIHVKKLIYKADDLGIISYLGDEISAEEIVPRFRTFLKNSIVSGRELYEFARSDVIKESSPFSMNPSPLGNVVSEIATFFNENDEHLWRDDDEVAGDESLDEMFYVLKVDLDDADIDRALQHFAERGIFGIGRNVYDLWIDPLSNGTQELVRSTLALNLIEVKKALSEQVHYLGPLRGDGYTVQNVEKDLDSFLPVGLVGEQVVQRIFEENVQNRDVWNLAELIRSRNSETKWNPEYFYPCPGGSTVRKVIKSIEEWIQFFDLGKEVLVHDLGVLGLQIYIDKKNLYQLGSGVSQILPVIVSCLVAEPGSLTIIEQPELHLHPAAQQKLADFFLAMSKSGRNLLIETHSEYMINRTRRDVALKKAEASDIQLFFAERGENETTIREANLTGSGGFQYWPKGFFSQTEDDLLEIIRALQDE